jgi:uncharacterized protein (TIGR02594 family)
MTDHVKLIADTLRPAAPDRIIKQDEMPAIIDLAAKWAARDTVAPAESVSAPPASVAPSEPKWLSEARKLIGTREIPGPGHNSFISKGWARLGASWFNDDETPWCGYFVAHCIDAAGLPYPGKGLFARAKEWLNWGKASQPVLGAVVVFGRDGGGHVGFLVGQSAANWYVLGGNQGNMVSITPIAKARALGYRWPASLPASTAPLPQMTGGTVSRNEA